MNKMKIDITAEQVRAAEIDILDIERRLLSGDALSQKEREFYEQVKQAEELILTQI
ncbi:MULTISPECIES: hypothetical protein [unclassified Aeromonas]|uniref:hypothetical protein n=1 Tax=unclassified Aeromonas TaxID=257493 RepID=UPI003528A9EC